MWCAVCSVSDVFCGVLIGLQRLESEEDGYPTRQDPSTYKFGPDDLEGTACRVSGGFRYTIGVRWPCESHRTGSDVYDACDCGTEGSNYDVWKAGAHAQKDSAEGNHFVYTPRVDVKKEPVQKGILPIGPLKKLTNCFGYPFRCLYWQQF